MTSGIYGRYAIDVEYGTMNKEEAARLARQDSRAQALIKALEAIKHSSHDERRRAQSIVNQYFPMK